LAERLWCAQGALYGIRSVAQGFGPLLFSGLFAFFTADAHYFPSAPLVACAGLMAAGTAIAVTMHIPPRPSFDFQPFCGDPEDVELLGGDARSHGTASPEKRGESIELLAHSAGSARGGGRALDADMRGRSLDRSRSLAGAANGWPGT
jgi:hypothetical protein